jgi:hypothetical protein
VFLWSQAVFACHEDRPDFLMVFARSKFWFQLVQVKAQAKAEMHGKAKAGVSYVFEDL